MKLPLLLVFCGAFALPTSAQNAPQNGYITLVAAGKMLLPGENGGPSSPDAGLSPDENLRRERLAVARNAPALKLLREALKQEFHAPPVQTNDDLGFKDYGSFRELARQLRQESDVRFADGDVPGALDSRLSGVELGAAITSDAPIIGALVGAAIEFVARKDFEVVAAKLDAPQIRAALVRLKAIDARRATPTQSWQVEKVTSTRLLLSQTQALFDPEKRKILATPEGRAELEMTEAQAQEMLSLTPEKLSAQIAQVFDGFIARDEQPYQRSIKAELPPAPGQYVGMFAKYWNLPTFRFGYDRSLATQRLFEGALELRAIRLESGAYPATYTAPIDPFADHLPLIYRKNGDGFKLYSIGPDGRDDNGAAIETIEINEQNGIKSLSNRLDPTSTGDILAPIF